MSARIGTFDLRLRTYANRSAAQQVAQEFRGALGDAFSKALDPYAEATDVAIIPRLRVTLSAPLGRISGRELARRIAGACIDAIAAESMRLGSSPRDAHEGTGERALRALRVAEGVRVDPATEAASWLIALARDEPCVLRHVSPYADLASRPIGAAFLEMCARSATPRSIVAGLGSKWARILALRCSPAEATALLRILDDHSEPNAAAWRGLSASPTIEKSGAPYGSAHDAQELTGSLDVMERKYARDPRFAVRVLVAALTGLFDRQTPGIVAAARAIVSSASSRREQFTYDQPRNLSPGEIAPPSDRAAETASPSAPAEIADLVARDGNASLESEFTGFWLLLPHVARYLEPMDDEAARAVVLSVAERLCGDSAASDPAIAAFMIGRRADLPLPLVPAGTRIDRLTVRAVRSFAHSLAHFEGARCGYVVGALLRGPGRVRRTPKGWKATLPRSPLRIVLEHASLLGGIETPWTEPVLELVRDL